MNENWFHVSLHAKVNLCSLKRSPENPVIFCCLFYLVLLVTTLAPPNIHTNQAGQLYERARREASAAVLRGRLRIDHRS